MRGFALIELLIIIALITVVSVFAIPFTQSFRVSSDLYTSADDILKTLRRAREQAIFGENNEGWGVYFDSVNYRLTIYQGGDFNTRAKDYDQTVEYSSAFTVNTDFGNSINFSKNSGQPSALGAVTVASQNNQNVIINIDSNGKIQVAN